MGDERDSDPLLLNVSNGTLNLTTGEHRRLRIPGALLAHSLGSNDEDHHTEIVEEVAARITV